MYEKYFQSKNTKLNINRVLKLQAKNFMQPQYVLPKLFS